MQTTVIVSRSFTFDPDSQGDVVSEIKSLRDRGFDILGAVDAEGWGVSPPSIGSEIGSLEPVEKIARRGGKKPSGIKTADIAAAIDEIRKLTGLSLAAIALLVGVHQTTIGQWKRGDRTISAGRWLEVQSLLRRARSAPDGDRTLHSEARGLHIAAKRDRGETARQRGRSPKVILTDDQKIEIATLREGGLTLSKIADKFGVTISRVRDVLSLFA